MLKIDRLLNINRGESLETRVDGLPQVIKSSASDLTNIFTIDDIDYLFTVIGLRLPFVALSNSKLGYTNFHDVQFQQRSLGIFDPSIVIYEYLKNGTTIIIKHLSFLSPRVNQLVNLILSEIFPYTVQCNAYLTPPNSQGVPIHADPHHTLLIQLSGSKHWKVWKKISGHSKGSSLNSPDNASEAKEIGKKTEPILEAVIESGDVLFMPKGYVHTPFTNNSHSLHLTLGIQNNDLLSLGRKVSSLSPKEALKKTYETLINNDSSYVERPFIEIV
jgi:hypothetical protein